MVHFGPDLNLIWLNYSSINLHQLLAYNGTYMSIFLHTNGHLKEEKLPDL